MAVMLYCLSGVARSGATRSGYTSPSVFVAINGVQYATGRPVDANKVSFDDGLTITENARETANTAAFTMMGAEPTEGQEVVITIGSMNNIDRLFAGNILNRTHRYVGTPANWNAPVNVIDYTWHLTRRKFSGSFVGATPDVIAAAIVAVVPGFTLQVQAGLPAIAAFSQTNVTALAALGELARATGGVCTVDYHKVVKVFTLDTTVTNPVDLTTAHITLTEFEYTKDLSQVRTRVYSEGGGVTALTQVNPGESILPLSTVAWYNAAGGMVRSGPQRLTYTGVQQGGTGSLVGPGARPSAAPSLALLAGTGLSSGAYQYEYTFITAAGESLPSPLATITVGSVADPATVPSVSGPTAGAGPDFGTHRYAFTFTTATGESLPSPLSVIVTTLNAPIPTPAPWSCASSNVAGGALTTNSYYSYLVTFVDGVGGETLGQEIGADLFANTNHTLQVFNIPTSSNAAVVSRKLYRSTGRGSSFQGGPWGLVTTIGDNTTTVYNDGLADASLGAAPPSSNTARYADCVVAVSGIGTGGASVTGRKLYRTAAGGSQLKLLTTFANNTTTTFTDTFADSTLGANAPTVNTAGGNANQVSLSGIAVGASPTTSRKLYRTVVGGTQPKLLATIANNTATTFTDSTADGSLGVNAPTGDTSGLTQPSGQINAGSNTLLTSSPAPFSASGGWVELGGGQVVRYTGISGNTLTGIPLVGVGAITAAVTYGTSVTASPALVGIPTSGAGSVIYPILQDDQVNLVVQVDDTAAQATLAALIGGGDDGVVEDYIEDGTIGETLAIARATARLQLLSLATLTVTYKCRDVNSRAGRFITISFGPPTNISASFLIQHVTINTFQPALMPTFTVQASSDLLSLDELLRLDRAQAA